MASSAASLAQILAGFALSAWLGFGPSYFLLAGDGRRYSLAAAPAAGYALFCLLVITSSTTLQMSANHAVWTAFALMSAVSLAAVVLAVRRSEMGSLWNATKLALVAIPVMLLVIFWPVVIQGADLYLGTANIDFYQSLAYQEGQARYDIAALAPRPAIDYSFDPFLGAFPDSLPARFGGVMFSLLGAGLFGLEPRAALMTSLAVFVLALPLATFFFAKMAMDLPDRAAFLAALLIAVSGPVTMSFVHVLVGQNSSLPLLPLAIAVAFIALRTMQWRALIFAVLLLDAVFWIYVSILPYVLAPVGLYGLYRLVTGRAAFLRWAMAAVAAGVAILVLVQWGMLGEMRQLVAEIAALFARANRSVYVDFLTEMALPYTVGVSSYPVRQFFLFPRGLGSAASIALVMGFVALAFAGAAFVASSLAVWARGADVHRRVLVVGAFVIYLAVCVYFSVVSLYGYALFKMASWLQFLFVPIAAYGLYELAKRYERGRGSARRLPWAAAVVTGLAYAGGNLVSAVDFGVKGLGADRERGAIVNSYGIGGNPDYPALEAALRIAAKPGQVVAIGMPDYIANLWAAYYVSRAGLRAALLSHDDFPDEDAILPDIRTGIVTNTAGTRLPYKPRYHVDGEPDYYLLAGPGNLNREIVETTPRVAPVWADGSFMLVRPQDAKDVLVTGRGFYRLEYFDRDRLGWWWPDRIRWTAQGGELLLLHASRPEVARRLSFVVLSGPERDRPRHVELWLNGVLIDEMEIHGAARVVSKPFHPTGGRDKLVLKIRESIGRVASSRAFGLWNRQIALEQRDLNVVIAQMRLLTGDDSRPPVERGVLDSRRLIEASSRFDGISLDGWARPKAYIELPMAGEKPRRLVLSIEVPAWASYRFPFIVRFGAVGRIIEARVDKPGVHEIRIDDGAGSGNLMLTMESQQSTPVPGTGEASFLIRSLTVE